VFAGARVPPPPADSALPTEVTVNAGVRVQYAQPAAVATMIEKYTPMVALVEPTKSHVAAMPLFQRREMDFIFVNQAENASLSPWKKNGARPLHRHVIRSSSGLASVENIG